MSDAHSAFEQLPVTIHASAVCFQDRGALILGPSGSGKSTLALQLISLGAALISDDLTHIRQGPVPEVTAPPGAAQKGGIEARGFGLLQLQTAPSAPVHIVLDLSKTEEDRLPPPKSLRIGNQTMPLFHKVDSPAFPAMVMQYLLQDTLPRER